MLEISLLIMASGTLYSCPTVHFINLTQSKVCSVEHIKLHKFESGVARYFLMIAEHLTPILLIELLPQVCFPNLPSVTVRTLPYVLTVSYTTR